MTRYTVTLDGEVVARQTESQHVDSVIHMLESEGVSIDDIYWNEDQAKVELTSKPDDVGDCYVCSALAVDSNLCEDCEENGYWIDPAGGVHSSDEEDPAGMYE